MPKSETKEIQKSEEVSVQLTPIQRFQRNLESYEQSILPSLLKRHNIDAAQFKYVVLSEIKKDPKLLQAFTENPASMFASILAGAEIGLIPSDMLGEFYLIPRQINGKLSVTPQIGYKGMVTILLRSGEISKVNTEVVYEGDAFEVEYGFEQKIVHKPNFTAPRNSKTMKYVYAVAKMRNGEYQFCVLTREDVLKLQKLSKYNNSLYFNDERDPQMWMIRKTALVQLAKMLPKDYYAKKAVSMDNALEGGSIVTLDGDNQIKVIDGAPIKPTRFRDIYGTLGSVAEEENTES